MKFVMNTLYERTAQILGIVGVMAVAFAIGFPYRASNLVDVIKIKR